MDSLPVAGSLFIGSIVANMFYLHSKRAHESSSTNTCEDILYNGNCHCKAVTFEIFAPRHLLVWNCNCSVCDMKKNWHVVVPNSKFKLLTGSDDLQLYTFNTHVAKHYFCKHCGVQSFYIPRSNPDGYAVTFACLQAQVGTTHEMKGFDGQHWEDYISRSGIQTLSK
mmetsp:Transcript_11729/g.17769  ORF Transcript_11729/g.17769 Transcript_11729/m.17769 type:complete len:167 (+) Transcript_11729:83-583(+)